MRLSPNEHETVRTAAKLNRQSVTGFIRDAVSSAAGDCLERQAEPKRNT
jgi:uncharacterized protein (DUF1778 family)